MVPFLIGFPSRFFQHDLGNRDQQVDEEDDRTAGIQQELEDEIRREGRGDDAEEPDDRRRENGGGRPPIAIIDSWR